MATPSFVDLVGSAIHKVEADLALRSPALAEKVAAWLHVQVGIGDVQSYFLHPESLPILALPWWLETSISATPDTAFQADLLYSTVSGYYFTRLLDDLMDGEKIEAPVIPALAIFQIQFHQPYLQYFAASDEFWERFRSSWALGAENTSIDATFATVTEDDFVRVSGRKTIAAVIPIAAVCFRYQRLDLLEQWTEFFTLLARWHQMADDLRDWSKDEQSGLRTWLLSEAEQRRMASETTASWLGREGFQWVKSVLDVWMAELVTAAEQLNSPAALEYVHLRQTLFTKQISAVLLNIANLARIFNLNPQPRQ